jgi:hypothetical protein
MPEDPLNQESIPAIAKKVIQTKKNVNAIQLEIGN